MAMSNTLAINPAPIRELKNTAAMIGSKSYSRKNCFLTHLKQESQKICKNEVWSASQKTNAAEDTAAAPEDSRLQTSTAAAINSQARLRILPMVRIRVKVLRQMTSLPRQTLHPTGPTIKATLVHTL
jgi:hypothetical protein